MILDVELINCTGKPVVLVDPDTHDRVRRIEPNRFMTITLLEDTVEMATTACGVPIYQKQYRLALPLPKQREDTRYIVTSKVCQLFADTRSDFLCTDMGAGSGVVRGDNGYIVGVTRLIPASVLVGKKE